MAEDLLSYIDYDETNINYAYITTTGTRHNSLVATRAFGRRYPVCEICYIEECIMRILL